MESGNNAQIVVRQKRVCVCGKEKNKIKKKKKKFGINKTQQLRTVEIFSLHLFLSIVKTTFLQIYIGYYWLQHIGVDIDSRSQSAQFQVAVSIESAEEGEEIKPYDF